MPEFFTSREVKEKPFLFVSYSHNNKEITDNKMLVEELKKRNYEIKKL